MKKEFCRYVFPSMLSFLLTGVYSIVDGIFVGNAVGDNGLAAINIAWPLAALIISLGTGIGMGASVIMSLNRGAGDEKTAVKAEGNAFLMMVSGALILSVILFFACTPLLKLLGAEGIILTYGKTYIHYILLGAVAQVCAGAMLPLIRNHGASVFAMVSMAAGCLTNILLDWIFVTCLNMELMGAALATVCGQVLTLLLCLSFFLRKEHRACFSNMKPDPALIGSILKVGISPFGLTYLPSITIIFMNLQTLKYGGTAAVSAYAILAYILSFMELLIQGISDGSQPLLSLSQGGGRKKELVYYRRFMFVLALGFGAVSGLLSFLLRDYMTVIFGGSPEAAHFTAQAAPAIGMALFLYGFSKPAIAYFYAIHEVTYSATLVYGEVFFTVAFIYLLPLISGIQGVWYTMPAVQLILGLLGILFLKRSARVKQNVAESAAGSPGF